MKQHSEQYWKWRTYALLVLAFLLVIWTVGCNGNEAYGQRPVKDSVPQPKRYVFVMDSAGYKFMDSVLRVSLRTTGYELSKQNADGLGNGLAAIINFFASEKYRQDTTVYKPSPKK